MKMIIKPFWRFALILAISHQCMAQPQPDFSALPFEQAEKVLLQASKADFRNLTRSALLSKRLDLINLCFDRYETRQHLFEEANKLTDEEFKEQVVLLMLRSNSRFWPQDDYNTGFQAPIPLADPIKGVLTKRFPGDTFGDDAVATRASRLALAARLASALGSHINEPIQPSNPAITTEHAAPPVTSSTTPPSAPVAPSEARWQPLRHLWLTGGALAVIVLAWLALKKRS